MDDVLDILESEALLDKVGREKLESFSKDLQKYITKSLLGLDKLFAKYPEIKEELREYGILVRLEPLDAETDYEPEDRGLN